MVLYKVDISIDKLEISIYNSNKTHLLGSEINITGYSREEWVLLNNKLPSAC